MAEQQLCSILHTFLSCPVCKETLRDPVSLGCNHSFCQTCLSEFFKKQSDKKCPLCKRKVSKDILIDFKLKELADCFALQFEDERKDRPDCSIPTIQSQPICKKRNTKDESTTLGMVELEEDLVDWTKPLVWQVGHLREKYSEWVQKPVDRPIRLFESDIVEAITKTTWNDALLFWVIMVIWLTFYCWTFLSKESDYLVHDGVPLMCTLGGLFLWLFLIYCVHFLLHCSPPAHSYYLITLDFVLHGQHHKNPSDVSRLVFPPALSILMMGILFLMLRCLLATHLALFLLLGITCGYVISDMGHYYFHQGSPSEGSWLYSMQNTHIKHHSEH